MSISLKNIHFKFKDKVIFDDFNIDFKKNQTSIILGKSGSGKTTLLKILSGILFPEKGEIYIQERIMPHQSHFLIPGYDNVAYLSQDFDLKVNHTVFDNLNRLIERNKNRVFEPNIIIQIIGLEPLLQKQVKKLSIGEKQRVALAVALFKNTEIIILDEPFSNLDLINRRILLEVLSELKGKKTILIAMHEAQEALSLADEIFLLKEGIIIERGSPKQIYYNPTSLESANLVGIINQFKTSELESFNWNTKNLHKIDEIYLIRPNQLYLNNMTGVSCKIKNQYFKGLYYSVEVLVNNMVIEVFSKDFINTNQRWKLDLINPN